MTEKVRKGGNARPTVPHRDKTKYHRPGERDYDPEHYDPFSEPSPEPYEPNPYDGTYSED